MPKPRAIPNRFQRTRRDHALETAEDYVEAIADCIERKGACRIVDLAETFHVTHVTVTKIISRLKREGLVTNEPYRPLQLLEPGLRMANEARRRHQIVLGFLLALGVGQSVAEVDTEGIEHHVSDETLRRFESWIPRLRRSKPRLKDGD